MTDNEIIKALECCIEHKCHKCPARAMFCSESIPMAFALDLINRQKAEIERLQETICMLTKTGRFYSTVRAETIKECIKTIKEKLRDLAKIDFRGQYCYLIAEAFFDNIFEEMVGDVWWDLM